MFCMLLDFFSFLVPFELHTVHAPMLSGTICLESVWDKFCSSNRIYEKQSTFFERSVRRSLNYSCHLKLPTQFVSRAIIISTELSLHDPHLQSVSFSCTCFASSTRQQTSTNITTRFFFHPSFLIVAPVNIVRYWGQRLSLTL